ncbi:MAG: hypothetical protein ABID84_00265 [Chloroflexota bacterium]
MKLDLAVLLESQNPLRQGAAYRSRLQCQLRGGRRLRAENLHDHSSLTMTRIYAEQVNSEDAVRAYKPIVC